MEGAFIIHPHKNQGNHTSGNERRHSSAPANSSVGKPSRLESTRRSGRYSKPPPPAPDEGQYPGPIQGLTELFFRQSENRGMMPWRHPPEIRARSFHNVGRLSHPWKDPATAHQETGQWYGSDPGQPESSPPCGEQSWTIFRTISMGGMDGNGGKHAKAKDKRRDETS